MSCRKRQRPPRSPARVPLEAPGWVWNDSVQYDYGSVEDVWLDHIISKSPGSFAAVVVNTMPHTEYYEMDCVPMEVSGAEAMHAPATNASSGVSMVAADGPEQPIAVKP